MTAATRVREPRAGGVPGADAKADAAEPTRWAEPPDPGRPGGGPSAAEVSPRPVRAGIQLRTVRRPVPPRPLPARPAHSSSELPSGRSGQPEVVVVPVPAGLARPDAPAEPLRRAGRSRQRIGAPVCPPRAPEAEWERALPAAGSAQPRMAVYLVAAAVVTLALVGGLGWLADAVSGPAVPERTSVVRVGAGETVWDVAARVAPQSDPRAVVERMRELNGLVGSAVEPGQQLTVPTER